MRHMKLNVFWIAESEPGLLKPNAKSKFTLDHDRVMRYMFLTFRIWIIWYVSRPKREERYFPWNDAGADYRIYRIFNKNLVRHLRTSLTSMGREITVI